MNTVNMPGFTADASLCETGNHYYIRGWLSQAGSGMELVRAAARISPNPSRVCVAACAVACAGACITTCVGNFFGAQCTECTDNCMNQCAQDCPPTGGGLRL